MPGSPHSRKLAVHAARHSSSRSRSPPRPGWPSSSRRAPPPQAREVAPERVRTAAPPKPVVLPSPPACPKLVLARGDAPLLDDWEENDSRVAPLDGRAGNWATYDDGTGKQTPPDKSPLFPSRIHGGRGASTRALHMVGGKFKDWGVTFGAELADAACYDASAYAGIEFWAKGPGVIKVGFQMIDVQDEKYGGLCKSEPDCYNTHRKVVELSKGWKHYTVRWEELAQLYQAGPPLTFDPRRVRFFEFGIGPDSTPFDLWIDDVAFVKRERTRASPLPSPSERAPASDPLAERASASERVPSPL